MDTFEDWGGATVDPPPLSDKTRGPLSMTHKPLATWPHALNTLHVAPPLHPLTGTTADDTPPQRDTAATEAHPATTTRPEANTGDKNKAQRPVSPASMEPKPQKRFFSEVSIERFERIAVNISFGANILLLGTKIAVLATHFMLVMLASVLDSALDVMSGSILWLTCRLMDINEPHNYPAGKSRFEPIGIIVFACIMATSSLQIFIFSGFHLAETIGTDFTIDPTSFAALAITMGTTLLKFLLYLFCRIVATPMAQAYAEDHRNDVVMNLFTFGVMFLIRSFPTLWWCDDIGAMVIATYIMYNWIKTGTHQVKQLAAYSADEDHYSSVVSIVQQYSQEIAILDLKAYHFGPRLFVEVIIYISPEKSLYGSQRLILGLKGAVECLDSVEKCFISVDHKKSG